jgi:glutathione peroxidase-family protein
MSSSSFYKLTVILGDGTVQSMQAFAGKVVFATNVASM